MTKTTVTVNNTLNSCASQEMQCSTELNVSVGAQRQTIVRYKQHMHIHIQTRATYTVPPTVRRENKTYNAHTYIICTRQKRREKKATQNQNALWTQLQAERRQSERANGKIDCMLVVLFLLLLLHLHAILSCLSVYVFFWFWFHCCWCCCCWCVCIDMRFGRLFVCFYNTTSPTIHRVQCASVSHCQPNTTRTNTHSVFFIGAV